MPGADVMRLPHRWVVEEADINEGECSALRRREGVAWMADCRMLQRIRQPVLTFVSRSRYSARYRDATLDAAIDEMVCMVSQMANDAL